jgi:hypothetical protein
MQRLHERVHFLHHLGFIQPPRRSNRSHVQTALQVADQISRMKA